MAIESLFIIMDSKSENPIELNKLATKLLSSYKIPVSRTNSTVDKTS